MKLKSIYLFSTLNISYLKDRHRFKVKEWKKMIPRKQD